MTDQTLPGPAPSLEHVDQQGCDLFEKSPVEAVRAKLRELEAPIYGTRRQLWLPLWHGHLQSAVEPVAPHHSSKSGGDQTTSSHTHTCHLPSGVSSA